MASQITLNTDKVKILALGEVTAREVFEYDAAGVRTTIRRLGPSGKPLFSVGPLAVEVGDSALGEVRLQTETPEALAEAKMGTAYIAPGAVVTIRSNQNDRFNLAISVVAPTIEKAGGLPSLNTPAGKAAA